MLKIFTRFLSLVMCSMAAASIAGAAQDLPKTNFKIVGHNSPQLASKDEMAFWKET